MIRIGLVLSLSLSPAWAATEAGNVSAPTPPGKVQYRKGKDLNFDEALIQGQNQRPEATVVTGNVRQGGDGLIRLRENFVDRVAVDYAEELE